MYSELCIISLKNNHTANYVIKIGHLGVCLILQITSNNVVMTQSLIVLKGLERDLAQPPSSAWPLLLLCIQSFIGWLFLIS